jgi:hypothetical protein
MMINGREIRNNIQRNSNALKNMIVHMPKKMIRIPPNICHLKAIHTMTMSNIHGITLGMFINGPLFWLPDIRENARRDMDNSNNKTIQNDDMYDLTLVFMRVL